LPKHTSSNKLQYIFLGETLTHLSPWLTGPQPHKRPHQQGFADLLCTS